MPHEGSHGDVSTIAPTITVTVVDAGFFQKTFSFSPTTNLQKLIDRYTSDLCPSCTNGGLLDFWYETTKIENGHTAKLLGMQSGDIIDVQIAQQCTRGACPIPSQQTSPNIHYLTDAPSRPTGQGQIQEEEQQPEAPTRITLKVRDVNNVEMVFRTKIDTKLIQAMRTFATKVSKEVKECRFYVDGERLTGDETPEVLEMEEGDLIEVGYEVLGGSMALIV